MSDHRQENAADADQIAYAERKAQETERRMQALWRQQLSTRDGREFVWNLLGEFQIFEFIGGPDVNAVYMQLGLRNFGAQLLADLTRRHAKAYLVMQKEAIDRDELERAENAASRTAAVTRSL